MTLMIKIVEWIAVIDVLAMFALIFGYRTWELITWEREFRRKRRENLGDMRGWKEDVN